MYKLKYFIPVFFIITIISGCNNPNSSSETDEAEYWLMERLEEGPQPAGDLIRIGEEFGYTPKILRDAGERFNMERYKDGLDHWMWKLPNFKHKSDDQTS